MKKFLLFFWNIYVNIRNRLDTVFHFIFDFFYRKLHKPPVIMSCEETVKYILETGCSVARFGDGEIKLIAGKKLRFQNATDEIRQRLSESLSSDLPELLICLPRVFSDAQRADYTDEVNAHWRKHLAFYRKKWYSYLKEGKIYGNAFISRNYIGNRIKGRETAEYYEYVKKLWDNRDIVIVEGEKSRLGLGNDLFNNANSIKRILCPSSQCFSKYNEIIAEIKKQEKSALILLAVGPTASVIPLDICKLGYQIIDIGNIDTEYEWFLMGATSKTPIKNKMVYEARGSETVSDTVKDEKYNSEIIAKIL